MLRLPMRPHPRGRDRVRAQWLAIRGDTAPPRAERAARRSRCSSSRNGRGRPLAVQGRMSTAGGQSQRQRTYELACDSITRLPFHGTFGCRLPPGRSAVSDAGPLNRSHLEISPGSDVARLVWPVEQCLRPRREWGPDWLFHPCDAGGRKADRSGVEPALVG